MGAVCILGGIILSSFAMSGIRDAAEAETDTEREGKMFSNGDGIDPLSSPVARARALAKYQETHQDGPLLKRLRIGQAIAVAGFLIWVIGIFI
jgi:hypothetical protein